MQQFKLTKKAVFMFISEGRYDFIREPTLRNKLICLIVKMRKGPAGGVEDGMYLIDEKKLFARKKNAHALIPVEY